MVEELVPRMRPRQLLDNHFTVARRLQLLLNLGGEGTGRLERLAPPQQSAARPRGGTVDTGDLKSLALHGNAGSNPALGTT